MYYLFSTNFQLWCVIVVTVYIFRDIKDTTVGSLSQQITGQLMGLKGLHSHMSDISTYLKSVAEGRLPINHQIIYQLQVIQSFEMQHFIFFISGLAYSELLSFECYHHVTYTVIPSCLHIHNSFVSKVFDLYYLRLKMSKKKKARSMNKNKGSSGWI